MLNEESLPPSGWTKEQLAEFERTRQDDMRRQYVGFRTGARKWSHTAAVALMDDCRTYFNDGGPVWPLIYRKYAEQWMRGRIMSPRAKTDALWSAMDAIQPIVPRNCRDWDVLDGRDVVRVLWKAFGRQHVENKCADRCDGHGGYVYVMQHEPFMGKIKIGKTVCLKNRARALSMQAGLKVEVLGAGKFCCYDMAGSVEGWLHCKYENRRGIGEWFRCDRVSAVEVSAHLSALPKPISAKERRHAVKDWARAHFGEADFQMVMRMRIDGMPDIPTPKRSASVAPLLFAAK